MQSTRPIAVIGAGYGGLAAARELGFALRRAGLASIYPVTLVDYSAVHELKPKIPEAVGEWTDCDVEVPIEMVLAGLPVTFQQTAVRHVDLAAHTVETEAGSLPYWRLVWALGAQPDFAPGGQIVPGAEEFALAPYTRTVACRLRRRTAHLLQQAATLDTPDARRPLVTLVVAGGGFVGVELAGELADRLKLLATRFGFSPDEPRVVLVESRPMLLGFDRTLADAALQMLQAKGVDVRFGVGVAEVRPDGARLTDGSWLPSRIVVWAGGLRGHPLAAAAGLDVDHKGRIVVDASLRAVCHPDVYAIGDGAYVPSLERRPDLASSGQAAVAQGKAAARAILAEISGARPAPYRPHSKGVVILLGHRQAIARVGPFAPLRRIAPWLKQAAQLEHLWDLGGPRLVAQHWGSIVLPLIAATRVKRYTLAGDAPGGIELRIVTGHPHATHGDKALADRGGKA